MKEKMDNTSMKKKVFSNKNQIERLVGLMEQHPLIGRGILKKNTASSYWNKFSEEINSLGPPIKTPEKWLKVWIDLKANVKKKCTDIKSVGHVNGKMSVNGFLSLTEQRISKFFSPNLNKNQTSLPTAVASSSSTSETISSDPTNISEATNSSTFTPTASSSFPIHSDSLITFQSSSSSEGILKSEEDESSVNIDSSRNLSLYRSSGKNKDRRLKIYPEIYQKTKDIRCMRKDIQKIKKYQSVTAEYIKKMYYLQKRKNKELLALKRAKLKIWKENKTAKKKSREFNSLFKKQLLELIIEKKKKKKTN